MASVERPVTASLIIREMCRELWMTEEQLLVHLAVEHIDEHLSKAGQRRVSLRAAIYHRANVFMVAVRGK